MTGIDIHNFYDGMHLNETGLEIILNKRTK